MKRISTMLILILASSLAAFPQTAGAALERLREIRFLQDNSVAVRQVLHDYVLDREDETSDDFSLGDVSIEVFYSSGTCDEDEKEIWDVGKGKVIRIELSAENLSDTGIDLTKLEKEQKYAHDDSDFIYHDKKVGIAAEVAEDEIDRIILFPSVTTKAKTCGSKYAGEFVSMKSWFGGKKLEERYVCILVNQFANVTDVSLSHDEIGAGTQKQVKVSVTAVDPENDVLTYNYKVSAGTIIGSGANVVWDLMGVSPGTHSIWVGVDDGAGIVGKTGTKTVTIK